MLRESFFVLPFWVGPVVALLVYIGLKQIDSSLTGVQLTPATIVMKALSGSAAVIALVVIFVWIVAVGDKIYRRRLLATNKCIEDIRRLSWQEFELFVGEALRQQGYTVLEYGGGGADGGIDLIARKSGETMLVQCKHWKNRRVGVKVIREVFGLLMAEEATKALIVTTGQFTEAAHSFANNKTVQLMGGEELVQFIGGVRQKHGSIVEQVQPTLADLKQPSAAEKQVATCPMCSSPMVERTAKRGPNAGGRFYGCSRFPKCRGTRSIPGD